MKSNKLRSDFILWTVLAVCIVFAFILWRKVDEQGLLPPECPVQSIGVWGPFQITFNEPVDHSSVEKLISITPAIAGHWKWQSNTITFQPDKPLTIASRYQISLQTGVVNLAGEKIGKSISCPIQVRAPQIIYESINPQQGELYKMDQDGNETKRLIQFKGPIQFYSVAKDGEAVAAAVSNETGGVDIWLINRDGSAPTLLVNCGKTICQEPHWSADNRTIAYSQKTDSLNQTQSPSTSQVWLVDIKTGEKHNLVNGLRLSGQNPQFSDDGQKIAFYDTINGGIWVSALDGSESQFLKSNLSVISWSPDSINLFYYNNVSELENPYMDAFIYNSQTHQTQKLLDEYKGQFDFGAPEWSPDGQWLAMGVRLAQGSPSRQLVLLKADGKDVKYITHQQINTYSCYHWSPDGSSLLFEGLEMGSSAAKPDIMIWNLSTEKMTPLLNGGGSPNWIP